MIKLKLSNSILFAMTLAVISISSCNKDEPGIADNLVPIKTTAAGYANLYSVVVSKDETIVMEEYYNGTTAESLSDAKSVNKGITSLIVGKAMELGYFNLQTELKDFLPEKYLTGLEEKKQHVTVEQLLTMSSGLGGLETDFSKWIRLPDEVADVLDRDLLSEPGSEFKYSTPNLQMLTVILQEVTGKTLHDFADEHVFGPMNIKDVEWPAFETGYTSPLMLLKSTDLLKIGQMVLNKGVYKSKLIMNGDYIAFMTTPKFVTATNPANSPKINSNWFGYLWWEVRRGDISGFMTAGYAGQFIAVFPTIKLVIAINSKANVTQELAVSQHQNATSLIADIVDAVK